MTNDQSVKIGRTTGMKTNNYIILHPFLFAIYPVLFILSVNLNQIPLSQSLRPLVISLLLTTALYLIFGKVSKNLEQGALSASIILILFFLYGHFYRWLNGKLSTPVPHIWLGGVWLILLLLGMTFKWKIRNIHVATRTLNFVGVVLLSLPLFQISIHLIRSISNVDINQSSAIETLPAKTSPDANNQFPDIYYIILDAYGRSDILKEIYGYDNSEFVDFLTKKGFIVAGESHSNYAHTTLSLASSLNMKYLDDLVNVLGEDYQDREPTAEMIRHSDLRSFLEQHGYQTVAFQTGSGQTMITDADLFIRYRPALVNDLEGLLITSSAMKMFGSTIDNLFNPFTCIGHQGSIQNIFANLAVIPEMPGPQFVFAHIMSPHPPFIFGADGRLNVSGECSGMDGNLFAGSRDEYKEGYRNQAEYISKQVEEVVEKILTRSTVPPLIIIQGDHGPGLLMDVYSSSNTCIRERMSILNAYYLPGVKDDMLYPSITPVNTFRVVLNQYFDARLPLLDDRLYYSSSAEHYYRFEDVTNTVEEPCS